MAKANTRERTMSEPNYIKESRRLIADCGLTWSNPFDLLILAQEHPDLADVIMDVYNWIVNRIR